MRTLITILASTLTIGCALALAASPEPDLTAAETSDDRMTYAPLPSDEQTEAREAPSTHPEGMRRQREARQQVQSCTDEQGTVHPRGTPGFEDCIAAKPHSDAQQSATRPSHKRNDKSPSKHKGHKGAQHHPGGDHGMSEGSG